MNLNNIHTQRKYRENRKNIFDLTTAKKSTKDSKDKVKYYKNIKGHIIILTHHKISNTNVFSISILNNIINKIKQ